MRWITLVAALLLASGCAKGKPHLQPGQRTFTEVPARRKAVGVWVVRVDGKWVPVATPWDVR